MGFPRLCFAERPFELVRRPSPADQRARVLDGRLQPSHLRLAVRILQSSVIPDGNHAEHGQEERTSARQDVTRLRSHQKGSRIVFNVKQNLIILKVAESL